MANTKAISMRKTAKPVKKTTLTKKAPKLAKKTLTASKKTAAVAKPDRQETALIKSLKGARKQNGWSHGDVAKRMNKTPKNIEKLETVDAGNSPSLRNMLEYAKALGCRLEFNLINVKEEKARAKADKKAIAKPSATKTEPEVEGIE